MPILYAKNCAQFCVSPALSQLLKSVLCFAHPVRLRLHSLSRSCALRPIDLTRLLLYLVCRARRGSTDQLYVAAALVGDYTGGSGGICWPETHEVVERERCHVLSLQLLIVTTRSEDCWCACACACVFSWRVPVWTCCRKLSAGKCRRCEWDCASVNTFQWKARVVWKNFNIAWRELIVRGQLSLLCKGSVLTFD